jgi:phosphomevalonate kinase
VSAERMTLRGSPVVAAPGKIFLVGEYAVLDGAPAVVAAVSASAVGQFVPGIEPESPFVAESVQAALAGLGDRAQALPPGSVLIDSSAFQRDGKKLGLGSSAAVAAASVAAVMELAGLPVAANRDMCFALAERAHRTAQGGAGSGADVAAAVHGGIIQYRRPPRGYPVIQKAKLPSTVRLVVFAEGTPSSTVDMVRAVRAYADAHAEDYAQVMQPLREQAENFAEALTDGNVDGLLAAARSYLDGLTALGERVGVPIVTPRFQMAGDLAINLGGAAKPSGAGGGDVGVALFVDDAAARDFTVRLAHLGLQAVDLRVDTAGVHRRQPGQSS